MVNETVAVDPFPVWSYLPLHCQSLGVRLNVLFRRVTKAQVQMRWQRGSVQERWGWCWWGEEAGHAYASAFLAAHKLGGEQLCYAWSWDQGWEMAVVLCLSRT